MSGCWRLCATSHGICSFRRLSLRLPTKTRHSPSDSTSNLAAVHGGAHDGPPRPSAHRSCARGRNWPGYQTATLARLVAQVWSVEVVEEFAESARERLKRLAVENVKIGDGSGGWAEHAPYDKVLVAAGAKESRLL